ncbi:MAG TPA: hypothetical protein VKD43_08630, partial [Xanthobacteraceae bacterium]|nr:hypothetical protein [Xanthobacteraceae bacterium]
MQRPESRPPKRKIAAGALILSAAVLAAGLIYAGGASAIDLPEQLKKAAKSKDAPAKAAPAVKGALPKGVPGLPKGVPNLGALPK